MDSNEIIPALSALGQATRLGVFRLLVRHEPGGITAGEIARALGVPANTLSTHLAILTRCGLVRSARHSRCILYRADLPRLREIMLFLVADCCGASREVCAPLLAELIPCCTEKEISHV